MTAEHIRSAIIWWIGFNWCLWNWISNILSLLLVDYHSELRSISSADPPNSEITTLPDFLYYGGHYIVFHYGKYDILCSHRLVSDKFPSFAYVMQ